MSVGSEADLSTVPYLEDRYDLVAPIGEGGVATVYRATDRELGVTVAVKILSARWAADTRVLAQFAEEARIATRLSSPHIAEVRGLAVTWSGLPCIVYEHLEGQTLAQRIEEAGALSIEETADVVEQIARGLARAHQSGVIHRDVKPDNVFLVVSDDGAPPIAKLLDFGVAEVTCPNGATTDALLGTPEYIAPEILFGTGRADARSDLYALGVLAFECLTARCPVVGANLDDVLVRMSRGERASVTALRPDLPPELEGPLEAFFERALHEDPFWRFPSARELAGALGDAADLARLLSRRTRLRRAA